MVGANQLGNDCVKSLEESQWLAEDKLSRDNIKKFLEFLFIMFHVSGETRRAALSLSSKPEDKVVSFVSYLENKCLEKSNSQELIAAAVTTKATDICRYCRKKTGHPVK